MELLILTALLLVLVAIAFSYGRMARTVKWCDRCGSPVFGDTCPCVGIDE